MNQQDKELVLRIAEDLRIRHLIDDEPVYEFAHRYHLAKIAEATPPRHEILEAQAVALEEGAEVIERTGNAWITKEAASAILRRVAAQYHAQIGEEK